ncbi:MAG TPA: endo-1,4-beta-xylanase [Anaerolineales bacterium]
MMKTTLSNPAQTTRPPLTPIALLLIAALLSSCVRSLSSGPAVSIQTSAPSQAPEPIAGPTLRALAQEQGRWVGVAVEPSLIANDPIYAELLARQFNMITPEVAMKFEVLHPERSRYDFSEGDAILAFARAHNMAVRGHTLVWDQQLPAWLTEGQFSREEWRSILQDHIRTVVGHYRGKLTAWDVVNEAFDDNGSLRNTVWLRNIGPEYIALAFRWAHEADPQARLFYNDNGGEGLNRKSDAIYALAQGLLRDGISIGGIGMEMHTWLGGPPNPADLAANLGRLARLGLDVHITEMDIRTQYSQKPAAEKLADQASMYREIFSTCLAAPNCKAFVTWGLTDRYSWIPAKTNKPDAPLLFDEQGRPKPAFFSIRDALMGKPPTPPAP